MTTSDSLNSSRQRYYRVLLLPWELGSANGIVPDQERQRHPKKVSIVRGLTQRRWLRDPLLSLGPPPL